MCRATGSLAPFFDPGSVAVIGASRDPAKVGGSVLANLRAGGRRGAGHPHRETLDELRMAPALRGLRGEPPVDRGALADAISRFARFAVDFPELTEVELNPLIAGPDDAVAVDARATLARGGIDGHPEESRQA